jgi:m7GpppX diphosphatase
MSGEVHKPGSSLLDAFHFERVLSEDAKTRYAALLGYYQGDEQQGESSSSNHSNTREAAVVILEKTHFSDSFYQNLGKGDKTSSLEKYSSLGSNDVYNWILGWMPTTTDDDGETGAKADAHVKLTLIRPASEAHIIKYSEQFKVMVVETPGMYTSVVKPWVDSQPPERIQWVYNILEKKKEADTILYEKTGNQGFIVSSEIREEEAKSILTSLSLISIRRLSLILSGIE